MPLNLIAGDDDSGRRLDRVLRKALHKTPLSAIHRMLRQGRVLVDGQRSDADRRVQAGETITVPVTDYAVLEQKYIDQKYIDQKHVDVGIEQKRDENTLDTPEILFEGSGLLVLNKPAGISVHGMGSINDLVQHYLAPKLPPSLSFVPGPLHRLDKPSSGVLVFSTGLEGAQRFSAFMREGKIKKEYLALAEGNIESAELWQDELSRDTKIKKTFTGNKDRNNLNNVKLKNALTRVTPLIMNKNYSLIFLELETGRTHQIRAQAASRGYPLLGDRKYGGCPLNGGFLLHAWRLHLPQPFPPMIEAPPPENFKSKIRKFFGTDIQSVLKS